MQHIALYARVSSRRQDTRSQEPDLTVWAEHSADGQPVQWYRDRMTGRTMDRPGWNRLESDINAGRSFRAGCLADGSTGPHCQRSDCAV